MNLVKRAYLYLFRKSGKTISLFLFLLIMMTMMMTCISIQSAVKNAGINIKKALMGSFTVNAKMLPDGLNETVLQQILSIDGLTGNYTLRSYTQATLFDSSMNALTIEKEGAVIVPTGYEHAGKIVANNHSEKDTYFTKAGFKLIEGKHITPKQTKVALVHEKLAEQNALSIGDTLLLGNIENPGLYTEVTIQGIFTNTKNLADTGMVPSYDLYENVVFTDISTCSYLLFGKFEPNWQYGDFYVNDPETLNTIMDHVKEITGVTWEHCIITKYDNDYQNAKTALLSMQNILSVAMVIIITVCFTVLSLLLAFRSRNRIQEMGILLAMGISKKAILIQQLTEVWIVAAFALIFAYASSCFMAQQIGTILLSQTTGEKWETDTFLFLLIGCIGLLLCTASTVLAAIPILRIKPKKILSQIN